MGSRPRRPDQGNHHRLAFDLDHPRRCRGVVNGQLFRAHQPRDDFGSLLDGVDRRNGLQRRVLHPFAHRDDVVRVHENGDVVGGELYEAHGPLLDAHDSCAESVNIAPMRTAEDVLIFWFEEHGPADWFAAKPEFDAMIARGFTETHAAVARGEGWDWRSTPAGRLAEIIVLDQFSRQLFRGQAKAFASDTIALALAQEAVGDGHHTFVSPKRRI